jgi:hypothetical protein
VLQEQRAKPLALMRILDQERDFGLGGAEAFVASHGHDIIPEQRDQRLMIWVRSPDQCRHMAVGDVPVQAEEPEVEAQVGSPLVQGLQRCGVGLDDGADPHDASLRRERFHGATGAGGERERRRPRGGRSRGHDVRSHTDTVAVSQRGR